MLEIEIEEISDMDRQSEPLRAYVAASREMSIPSTDRNLLVATDRKKPYADPISNHRFDAASGTYRNNVARRTRNCFFISVSSAM